LNYAEDIGVSTLRNEEILEDKLEAPHSLTTSVLDQLLKRDTSRVNTVRECPYSYLSLKLNIELLLSSLSEPLPKLM
jgi:hypothetical protein